MTKRRWTNGKIEKYAQVQMNQIKEHHNFNYSNIFKWQSNKSEVYSRRHTQFFFYIWNLKKKWIPKELLSLRTVLGIEKEKKKLFQIRVENEINGHWLEKENCFFKCVCNNVIILVCCSWHQRFMCVSALSYFIS